MNEVDHRRAYASRLPTTHAPDGMVCSIDPLASSAGVAMLRRGGSAADAAVAASAVLAVTSPHMCGMGGDLFALVHDGGDEPYALNASGRAGGGADPERLRDRGLTAMPFRGDLASVPVPGCVDGWLALLDRFGRLDPGEVLAPAIHYARDGFPCSALLAAAVFLLDGVADADLVFGPERPRAGQRVRRPGVARTLEAVASDGRRGFYEGEFGRGLLALGAGEYLPEDLATSLADWVPPARVRVWDHDVWTIPPNSQGYLTLAALRIAELAELPEDPDDPRWAHVLIEAARLAGYDRPRRLHERARIDELLDDDDLRARADRIDPDATVPLPAAPAGTGDTIFLCAVGRDRQGVSLIQSHAADFGAHLVEPATGIFLHNRGIGFSLEPGHPAEYGPGRRPPSTLAPALVTGPATADDSGPLRACVGTMGGDLQPQVVLQLVSRLLRGGQEPGRAVAAPRWILRRGSGSGFDLWNGQPDLVGLEDDAGDAWFDALARRGHRVEPIRRDHQMTGHAHLIEVQGDVLAGAAEPRTGGAAVGL